MTTNLYQIFCETMKCHKEEETFSNIIHTKSQTNTKNFFPIRVTKPIVSLVTAKSLESLKTRLDKFWYTYDIV